MLEALTRDQIARSTGGGSPVVTDPRACSTPNATSARIYDQTMETSHAGPSVTERVDKAYDRAMAPWRLMNGVLRGIAVANR